jgi:hypothetical protein
MIVSPNLGGANGESSKGIGGKMSVGNYHVRFGWEGVILCGASYEVDHT